MYGTYIMNKNNEPQICEDPREWERALEGHSEEVTRQIKGEQTNET